MTTDPLRARVLREIHRDAIMSSSRDADVVVQAVKMLLFNALNINPLPSELTASCRANLIAHDTAYQLTEWHDCYTRCASEVGGQPYRWHVSGLGEVDTSDMLAHAASLGCVSRYADSPEPPASDKSDTP